MQFSVLSQNRDNATEPIGNGALLSAPAFRTLGITVQLNGITTESLENVSEADIS